MYSKKPTPEESRYEEGRVAEQNATTGRGGGMENRAHESISGAGLAGQTC